MTVKLVLDTSSLISLSLNGLLGVLEYLKRTKGVEFYIPPAVMHEAVDKPLTSKRFKFEAIRILDFVKKGVIYLENRAVDQNLMELMGQVYSVNGTDLHVVHGAEVEALALAVTIGADAFVVDERSMRLFVENPAGLERLMESKLHADVNVKLDKLKKLNNFVGDLKILRSTELVTVAFEKGYFNEFTSNTLSKEEVLDGLLWALKSHGCSIGPAEIDIIKKIAKYA